MIKEKQVKAEKRRRTLEEKYREKG